MQSIKFWLKVICLLLLWGVLFPRFVWAQSGTPDPAFGGGDGLITSAFLADGHAYPNDLAIQPDGKIVVVGSTWIPLSGQPGKLAIARYMPNGNVDPTFTGGGKTTISLPDMSISAGSVVLLPNGKILCAGGASGNAGSFFLLARFNADGTPDNTFDGDGIITTKIGTGSQYGSAMAVQTDGKIVVAGYLNLTGYDEIAVLRYKADGTLDNTFGGGDGLVTTPVGESDASASDVLLQPNGKIVVSGYAVINGYEDFAVMRYNTNGTPDTGFGDGDGHVIQSLTAKNDRATGLVLQPDGKIVLAGYAGAIGAPADVEMAAVRVTATGAIDQTFGGGDGIAIIHASDFGEEARAITLQPDGKILLGGNSRYTYDTYHFTVARLLTNGTLDNTFHGDGLTTLTASPVNDIIEAMAIQPDGKLVVSGAAWLEDRHHFGVARFISGITVDTTIPTAISGNATLYPNPVQEQANLEYTLNMADEITVNLYDVQGRFVQNMLPTTQKATGKHVENLVFGTGLPPGLYWLRIQSTIGTTVIKAIL